jgi:hypothetical protein
MQGEVSEDEIKHEISKIITEHIVEGVSSKVKYNSAIVITRQ